MELQGFHYYQGKNILDLENLPFKKMQHYFGSGRHPDQTQLGSTKPNKSPTWRLVQSPTSTAILQTQSLIPATHPPILKREDQLKLHSTSTSQ